MISLARSALNFMMSLVKIKHKYKLGENVMVDVKRDTYIQNYTAYLFLPLRSENIKDISNLIEGLCYSSQYSLLNIEFLTYFKIQLEMSLEQKTCSLQRIQDDLEERLYPIDKVNF